jgi:hypothetical protein
VCASNQPPLFLDSFIENFLNDRVIASESIRIDSSFLSSEEEVFDSDNFLHKIDPAPALSHSAVDEVRQNDKQ